jgi:hypothetical protein
MFARVLGPFFTIVAVVVAFRAPDMRTLLSEFTASAVWPWIVGAIALMAGISIVAFHQIWRGPAAIVISLIGWLMIARAIFLLGFPDTFAALADRMIGATSAWQIAYVVFGLVGLYLSYVGWKPVRDDLRDNDSNIGIDLPRAA